MVVTNSDFFSIFNQRRGELNEIILYFYFSFIPWITLSRVKWNIQEKVHFFSLRHVVYRGQLPPKKDGPPLCGLPPSYNNCKCPTSLLLQVPWQASYIVSFYPQYILNFFTSLLSWSPGQRNSPPHPWHIKKHLGKCTFSRILTHN